MWRALFLAIGLFTIILGVECLGVENVNLKLKGEKPPPISPFDTEPKAAPPKSLKPPGWAPWSLMACGSVVCLYSFTIPLRVQGK